MLASVLTAAAPLIATSRSCSRRCVIARSLLGVAHGGLFPVEAGTIRHWYPVTRWSSMLGLLVTGLWTGAAIASPLVASLMQAYGWQAAILLTSVPSLLLVVLWWIVVRDFPERHPWVKPAELAEIARQSRVRRRGAAHGAPRDAACSATRRSCCVTLSYLVMNYVFYLVTFWSFLYLVQERKLSVLESGWLGALPFVVAGVAAAAGGRIADGLRRAVRRPHRAAHPAARHAAARRTLPVPDRLDRKCLPGDRSAVPRLRLRRAQRRQLLGRRHAARAERLHGGDRGPEHRRQPRRGHRHALVAALSAKGRWDLVFTTGVVTSLVAALLWLTINPGRGERT